MKNSRISTTISVKHSALLKKYVEKYGTQQSVLEHALENLDNTSQQGPKISREAQVVLRFWEDKTTRSLHKDLFLMIMGTADLKKIEAYLSHNKMLMPYTIEFYYQKPYKELSLTEVLDGLIVISRAGNWYDTYTYSDDGDHYMLKMYHSLGLNGSKFLLMLTENALNACDVSYESTLSERTIFMKVYKNG
jgi:hypothetical protein